MPAARALSSPSGEAAEDNVEEREKRYRLRTDIHTYGQRDVDFRLIKDLFYFSGSRRNWPERSNISSLVSIRCAGTV